MTNLKQANSLHCKRALLLLLLCMIALTKGYAQIRRDQRTEDDGFKWIELRDGGMKGAESPKGKALIPIGNYRQIVYHSSYGGYFNVFAHNGLNAAFSKEGKELIPFSRGYDRIVKHEDYFGVRRNGKEGACDFDGNEVIEPQFDNLIHSSIDGFNYKENGKWIPIGIQKNESGQFIENEFRAAYLAEHGGSPARQSQALAMAEANTKAAPVYNAIQSSPSAQASSGASTTAPPAASTTTTATVPASKDKEQYRRSSLCLIMLTHRDKAYAEAMERVFRNFPLPARYNEHNISDLRVISVKGRQSKKDIDRIVRSNYVAKKVVGRWFNRSYSGRMNMDLIHERGGYGASYADYQRSQNNVRGADMLRDEGIELLQSTFVLVCDMDYADKSKSFWKVLGEVGMATLTIGSAVMSGLEQQNAYNAAYRGDYEEARRKQQNAEAWELGSYLGAAGTAVVADIGGFRVKMTAYLYKLRWDDQMTQSMYDSYWCDWDTPSSEAQTKRQNFDNAESVFALDYIGKYQATSSKTILRSWSSEDQVILDVCERCVNKGMRKLAKTFPVFKPRTPFYFEGSSVYSHIGSKEEVSPGKKYEIVQPYKDRQGQICYKRVGVARAGYTWDNKNVRFDRYFDPGVKGTVFYCRKAMMDLHTPGLQLREL